MRTYQRWFSTGNVREDKRPTPERPEPSNKLNNEEFQSVLNIIRIHEYADLLPSQIVPSLAYKGFYISI